MKACFNTLLTGLLATTAAWPDPPIKKVLIIGIDGTMPAALAVANTPNIDALNAAGAFSERAITHPLTHSAACWSSMFTGVWGDKHGVNDPGNSFSGNQFATYPNFMKRLEQADSSLSTVAYLRWAPLSTALAGTDEITSFGSDSAITTATVNKLTNGDPDVLYTILLDVDSAGHSSGWGPSVPAYVAAIIPTAQGWQFRFDSRTNLLYELRRSLDLKSWFRIDGPIEGNGNPRTLSDTSPPGDRAFYRVVGTSP